MKNLGAKLHVWIEYQDCKGTEFSDNFNCAVVKAIRRKYKIKREISEGVIDTVIGDKLYSHLPFKRDHMDAIRRTGRPYLLTLEEVAHDSPHRSMTQQARLDAIHADVNELELQEV